LVLFVVKSAAAAPPAAAADRLATFTVAAGKHDRIDTPVSVEVKGLGKLPKAFHLAEIKDQRAAPVPCQLELGDAPRLWWILSGKTPAGTKRVFALLGGAAGTAAPGVTVRKDESKLEVLCGGAKVLRYHLVAPKPPKGAQPAHSRPGYIHPLWSAPGAGGPAGQRVLTGDFPRDHYHHHGIWFPWTNTTFEGRHVDFWNLGGRQATIRLVKLIALDQGPVYGGFQTLHDHVVLRAVLEKDARGKAAKTGEKVALHETWDVRVFNLPVGKGWLWQITSTQWCASDSPLQVNRYHYGGMSLRASPEWNGSDPDTYRTDEGKTGGEVDKSLARWVIVSGRAQGQRDSVLMMSHPGNIHHPEGMRCWGRNRRVFLGWCPGKRKAFVMAPGKKYVFRYRWHVSQGLLPAKQAERLWQDFADPPAVTMSR
jgi:hypothetical protein